MKMRKIYYDVKELDTFSNNKNNLTKKTNKKDSINLKCKQIGPVIKHRRTWSEIKDRESMQCSRDVIIIYHSLGAINCHLFHIVLVAFIHDHDCWFVVDV